MAMAHRTIRSGGCDLIFFRRLVAAAVFVAAIFAVPMLPAEAQGIRPPGQVPAQQQPAEPERNHDCGGRADTKPYRCLHRDGQGNRADHRQAERQRQPSKQMMAQMDAIANKYGFNDFDDFGRSAPISRMVFGRIDPESRRYDPEAMIRRQIGAVHGDSKIPPKQKLQIAEGSATGLIVGCEAKISRQCRAGGEELRSPEAGDRRTAIAVSAPRRSCYFFFL